MEETPIKARVFKIVGREKALAIFPSARTDFKVEEESEGANPLTLLVDHSVSLYCVDCDNMEAVFVKCPSELDLTQSAAFFYSAQFENAQFMYTLPLDSLPDLLKQLPPAYQALDDSKVILIFSTGRCGSTYLSKLFERVEGVVSISEPDYIFVNDRMSSLSPNQLKIILEVGTRLMCRPFGPNAKPDANTVYALKFRSQATDLISDLSRIFPRSRRLYLYRNGETYYKSAAVAFQLFSNPFFKNPPPKLIDPPLQTLKDYDGVEDKYNEIKNSDLFMSEVMAMMWRSSLDQVRRHVDKAATKEEGNILCFRYEEMKADPRLVFKQVLEFCGLSTDNLESAVADMAGKDSQEGSEISQANSAETKHLNTPTAQHLQQFNSVLSIFPYINSPDYILPNTIILKS